MLRQWIEDWENRGHDVIRYVLYYSSRYPEISPPDLRQVHVQALYIPAVVVRKMQSTTVRHKIQSTGAISIHCYVRVPSEYMNTAANPPNGQPEPVRYALAYEAFWWNCVAVRAENLPARCPFMASGTPAASAGASNGASNAGSQIDRLLRTHVAAQVQRYLRSIASTPTTKEKLRPYFSQPTPEVVK
jgi:hypothetical protein